jgi:hypothetical protein
MGHEKVLRLLDDRVASCRVELDRLGVEAARLGKLIEDRGRELDRLTIAREVIGTLPNDDDQALEETSSDDSGKADAGAAADAALIDPVLGLVAELGGKVCCRDVVTALGENPQVARNIERIRRRLKLLVDQGYLLQSRPGIFILAGNDGLTTG